MPMMVVVIPEELVRSPCDECVHGPNNEDAADDDGNNNGSPHARMTSFRRSGAIFSRARTTAHSPVALRILARFASSVRRPGDCQGERLRHELLTSTPRPI